MRNPDANSIFDTAVDTLDRLRDLTPREVPIHVPDGLERWRKSAQEAERVREEGLRELRQQQQEMTDATELAAAERQVEHEESWDNWLQSHLSTERAVVLDIMGEVVGRAVAELREEYDAKVAALTRQVDAERAAGSVGSHASRPRRQKPHTCGIWKRCGRSCAVCSAPSTYWKSARARPRSSTNAASSARKPRPS
jgi:hypothetical protein